MTGAYVYTPDIWPPLAAAIFVAALGLYSWRCRNAACGKPFVALSLFASLWLLGIALEAAAGVPDGAVVRCAPRRPGRADAATCALPIPIGGGSAPTQVSQPSHHNEHRPPAQGLAYPNAPPT